ncbi:XisH protein [Gloeocapsa sp. PCC 7428]|uniref:XisH family protein n=1 Tax=Gloeocapsa sp. PCC 7428 TaxID=1173026 RepID=UPI0002A5FB5C|nr:XisH family protein [Gloeocapsa sp. PCC 7428]AFZ32996.1 XisH protein [Gloeocapsa sp. PCC 7428]
MPNRDRYHEAVKNALIKDGWDITHDPLHLRWGKRDLYVDLGAEELLAAERAGRRIAVEIKTFGGLSEIADLQQAVGQYCTYLSVIRIEPDRTLYLAVQGEVFADIFDEPIGQILLEDYTLSLIVFDSKQEVILKWIR